MTPFRCPRCRRHTLLANICAGCRADEVIAHLPRRALPALPLAIAALAAACESPIAPAFEPAVPTALEIRVPAHGFAGLGAGTVRVLITDQRGNPLPDADVTASVSNGGAVRELWARTNAAGFAMFFWRLGESASRQTFTATTGGRTALTYLDAEPPPMADLSISSLTWGHQDDRYHYYFYNYCFCAAYGDARVLFPDVDYYLSEDQVLNHSDLLVETRVEHLAVLHENRRVGTGIPKNAATGWRYLIAVINAEGRIPEANRNNNIVVSTVPIWFNQ